MTASPEEVLVVGESLIDVVSSSEGVLTGHAGGSAANVAIALARLGLPTRFATSFGRDEHGDRLADHLAASGVALAGDPRAVERTSTAVATIAPDGSASYAFDIDWRLHEVDVDITPRALHLCSYSALTGPGATVVTATAGRLHGAATISYDINLRPAITGTGDEVVAAVERLASLSTVVKASDEDLAHLYPHRSVEHGAAALLRLGPAAVVVTRGRDGASAWTTTGRVDVASRPTTVADTIGAGDTFMAGLIVALADLDLLGGQRAMQLRALGAVEWASVLEFASSAAAVTVSRSGANPPYRHELGPSPSS
ncbi:carbohydrate kinase family protein [Nocardioides ultimimeridianus]